MIGTNAFEQIQTEYDKKRLLAHKKLSEKKSMIEGQVPRIKEIEDAIASLSVSNAISRIKGGTGVSDYEVKYDALLNEKDRLLKENGFTAKDLEPEYSCELCNDTGYIENEMCSCFKRRVTEVLYDQLNIKEAMKEENFAKFDYSYYSNEIKMGEKESPLTQAKKAVLAAMDFVNNFDKSAENLLICGDTGVGKTFLTNCIVKELIDKDHFVIYLSANRFFQLLSDATFSKAVMGNESITKHIYNCDLLVIDDLGTEFTNTFTKSMLFDCINERLMSGKHTIISTNLSLDRIQTVYSERISSRLAARYTYIKLLGEDIRLKKKLEA